MDGTLFVYFRRQGECGGKSQASQVTYLKFRIGLYIREHVGYLATKEVPLAGLLIFFP